MRAPESSGDTLTLARVLLCHRHLDSRTRKLLPRATVKVAFAYLQSRERERVPGSELRRQRLHIAAARWSTRTLTRLLPRASRLNDRCTVVDTVSNTTRTPPRVPLRARAEKVTSLIGVARGNGMLLVAPEGAGLRAMRRV